MILGWATVGLAGAGGLALGSYAVTAGIRYGRHESSLGGRSHCDSCGAMLSFRQTVPVLSYLQARGACGNCRSRIDPSHLAGELGGLMVLLTVLVVPDIPRWPLLAGLGLLLVAISAIDWKTGRLPDLLVAPIAVIAGGLAAWRSWPALEAGLLASAIAFCLLQGLRTVSSRLRGDPGLGFGDVKLICALALWTGTSTPWLVVGATLLGIGMMALTRPAEGRLHFGPALALCGWLAGIGGECGLWPTTA